MANLIDGKAVSAKVKAAVKAETEELRAFPLDWQLLS